MIMQALGNTKPGFRDRAGRTRAKGKTGSRRLAAHPQAKPELRAARGPPRGLEQYCAR